MWPHVDLPELLFESVEAEKGRHDSWVVGWTPPQTCVDDGFYGTPNLMQHRIFYLFSDAESGLDAPGDLCFQIAVLIGWTSRFITNRSSILSHQQPVFSRWCARMKNRKFVAEGSSRNPESHRAASFHNYRLPHAVRIWLGLRFRQIAVLSGWTSRFISNRSSILSHH